MIDTIIDRQLRSCKKAPEDKSVKLIAIDPGCTDSAFVECYVDSSNKSRPIKKIIEFGKLDNEELLGFIREITDSDIQIVIEKIESYGMPVGREVFDTCVWSGRFQEAFINPEKVAYLPRKDEKLVICRSPRGNDATIRRALIDIYAEHDIKNGKGTKNNPDFFYGFKADVWAAFAVAHTYAILKDVIK